MSTQNKEKVGVILMTYGSATTAEHVAEYLGRIYHGKASATVIEEFKKRYRLIGRSPLIDITNNQAARLQESLGDGYVVRAGMRHSAPFIDDAVAECRTQGAESLKGVILSPQFSSTIMQGYTTAFMESAERHGFDRQSVSVADAWPTETHFIDLLVERIQNALELQRSPIIFTTHSMPLRVIEKDPSYLRQLEATINAVREKLDPAVEWYAGYQSAGHTPEAWLKPDLTDILSTLRAKKAHSVLIVPIQFLADHLEVLYDLDIAARAQCEDFGITYRRIELPNTHPLFIQTLFAIVQR
jgi:ferrochelatase